MLDDIEREIHYTRTLTGRGAFAKRVMDAMGSVPRDRFVPDELSFSAYANGPLPIGYGQTISQPYIVALMTDLLSTKEGDIILEIGTGSGYQAAVLSLLVSQVYSIELIPALGESARERLKELGYENVEVRVGDGYLGLPEFGPYDGIIVTAAADDIPPALVEQLKPGARLVIPVGRPYASQDLLVVTKDANGQIRTENVLPVAFVPLRRRSSVNQ